MDEHGTPEEGADFVENALVQKSVEFLLNNWNKLPMV